MHLKEWTDIFWWSWTKITLYIVYIRVNM